MRFAYVLVLLLVTLPTASRASASTVVVLGDSLSAAYNIELDQGWVSLLQARADQLSCEARIVNASISGETTAGGLARLADLLQRHQPSIVMIELGGNDALRGLSLSAFRSNLEGMIGQAREAGARIVLSEMLIPSNYGRRYRERFTAVYADLASADDVVLVPFLLHNIALDPDLMQADGIHPNAAAQPRILDNVWPALAPLLDCCAATTAAR